MSYKNLKSYQQTTIIYDLTCDFTNRYINPRSRTKDQMEQAARSGKQNIVEGTSFSKTSRKSEIKLIGVARGSLQELLEDYEDFLRQRSLHQWQKDDPKAKEIRNLSYTSNRSYKTYKSYLSNPETASNVAICLIHQANFLLDRQLQSLEEAFVKKGGYTENLFRKRNEERKKQLVSAWQRKHFAWNLSNS